MEIVLWRTYDQSAIHPLRIDAENFLVLPTFHDVVRCSGKLPKDEEGSLVAEKPGACDADETPTSKVGNTEGARLRRAQLQEAVSAEGAKWVGENDLEEFCARLEDEDCRACSSSGGGGTQRYGEVSVL